MIDPRQALERLRAGNARFVSGRPSRAAAADPESRRRLVEGQQPFAVVLGCSDSRVPAEIVFDQGPGDLFVVRVAGNVAGPSQIGSVEYAIESLGTRLVVVLGHLGCGAVRATLEAVRSATPPESANLGSIVDRIRPAVELEIASANEADEDELEARSVRRNVALAVESLERDSRVLARYAGEDRVVTVGAEYVLESGEVRFLDADLGG